MKTYYRKTPYSFIYIGIYLLCQIVYIKTLLPGVGAGDSGKFQFISQIWGIPHETGYPLYIWIGYIFSILPINEEIAYKINFMSSFFGALSAANTSLILWFLTKDRLICFITGLLLAFSPTLWSQAIIAEVYTLNLFFISTIFVFCILWEKERKITYLYMAVLFHAIGFGNHMSISHLVFPTIIFIIMVDRNVFKNKTNWIVCTSFILLGASQYLYLLFRSQYFPPYDELHPNSIKRVFYFATGGRFKQDLFGLPIKEFPARCKNYLFLLKDQFGLLPIIVAIYGIIKMWSTGKSFIALSLLWLVNFIFASNFRTFGDGSFIYDVHFIPGFFVVSLFIGLGGYFIRDLLTQYRHSIKSWQFILTSIVFISFILSPISSLSNNFIKLNQSNNIYLDTYTDNILKIAANEDKPSIILSPGYDYEMAFRYKAYTNNIKKILFLERNQPQRLSNFGCRYNIYYSEIFKKDYHPFDLEKYFVLTRIGGNILPLKDFISNLKEEELLLGAVQLPFYPEKGIVKILSKYGIDIPLENNKVYVFKISSNGKSKLWINDDAIINVTEKISKQDRTWLFTLQSRNSYYANSTDIIINGKNYSLQEDGLNLAILNTKTGDINSFIITNYGEKESVYQGRLAYKLKIRNQICEREIEKEGEVLKEYNTDLLKRFNRAKLVNDPDALSGNALKNGIIYGPYETFPPGDYKVSFHIKTDTTSTIDPLLLIEVRISGTGKAISGSLLNAIDFINYNKYEYKSLYFNLEMPTSLEFILDYFAKSNIWIDQIRLEHII